jgi:hypothetical protein
MVMEIKRASWIDAVLGDEQAHQFDRKHLVFLDEALHKLWRLGRNIVLLWAVDNQGLEVLVVPHYLIAEFADAKFIGPETTPGTGHSESFIENVISGPKKVELDRLREIAGILSLAPKHIELPFIPGQDLTFKTIDSLVKRYSISLVKDRAVALFDAVGFSLYSPLEQVTQLNSLAYSVNAAYSKLLAKEINIRFARTTTGDGFYIWNRGAGIRDAVDLYHFMHLVLADNAIARSKAKGNTVPVLRGCFHVGPHYEFYQSEGLSPTTFSYIVGDVTIDLARMIERAKAGQVLIGDFEVPVQDHASGRIAKIGTVEFIEKAQDTLSSLTGIVLSGDRIDSLKCYLTGDKDSDGAFSIKKYRISDKHGLTRDVFNAKVNIYRQHAEPIYLGIRDSELSDFDVVD